jgi:copper chaperone CopZ
MTVCLRSKHNLSFAAMLALLLILPVLAGCPQAEKQSETPGTTGTQESSASGVVTPPQASYKQVEFAVGGMSCTGCEEAIKAEIMAMQGVSNCEADHKDGWTKVVYNPDLIAAEDMLAVFEPLGYTAEITKIHSVSHPEGAAAEG